MDLLRSTSVVEPIEAFSPNTNTLMLPTVEALKAELQHEDPSLKMYFAMHRNILQSRCAIHDFWAQSMQDMIVWHAKNRHRRVAFAEGSLGSKCNVEHQLFDFIIAASIDWRARPHLPHRKYKVQKM